MMRRDRVADLKAFDDPDHILKFSDAIRSDIGITSFVARVEIRFDWRSDAIIGFAGDVEISNTMAKLSLY